MANQNQIARKREPYTIPFKPVFFQVAQPQKAPPPVTPAVSLTLLVVFTLGAQRPHSHPYVSATCTASSRAELPTGCPSVYVNPPGTTADDAKTTELHAAINFTKRHVRTG